MKEILRVLVGSRGYGLSSSSSDTDLVSVVIEPAERVVGFDTFEQQVFKSPEGDHTQYGLRKFLKLAMQGNPNILEVFFAPVLNASPEGRTLRDSLGIFVFSQQARPRYKGFLYKQFTDFEKGKGDDYDWKAAYNAIRLGVMGQEFLLTGKISMPMDERNRAFIQEVKAGKVGKGVVLDNIKAWIKELEECPSPLRAHPDRVVIEKWMIQMYMTEWNNV